MRSGQRIIATALLAAQLIACTSWHTEVLSPAEVIRVNRPGKVRVERIDGHREVLFKPEMHGDTVMGRQTVYDTAAVRAIPLTQIKRVESRHFSPGRTVVLVIGLGLMVALASGAAARGATINIGQ